VDGFLGLIFRRDPSVKLPEHTAGVAGALRVFAEDVDLMGTALFTFCKNVVNEVLSVGRCGSLVDWNSASRTGQEGGEERAYVVRYAAEQIINWKIGRVNGRSALTMVALKENAEGSRLNAEGPNETGEDEFEHESVEQIRVLRLVDGVSLMADGQAGGPSPLNPQPSASRAVPGVHGSGANDVRAGDGSG
jgi:hypothetical protein